MTKLGEEYRRNFPAMRRAKNRLRSLLREVVFTIEDKTLVRAEVGNIRIKKLASVERKATKNKWNASEALGRCGDLIGGRVVCNNVADVYRFAELLKERRPGEGSSFEIQDYIKDPNPRGYRALHVNFRINASNDTFAQDLVACEVQIRTRLQDAWSELTHDDLYKRSDLPEGLGHRAQDLAKILAAADDIAGNIRLRTAQAAVTPNEQPSLTRVSPEALAFVFRDVFGRSPKNYMIRESAGVCDTLDIGSLEQLPKVLGRVDFRAALAASYEKIVRWPISMELQFLASLYALAKDDRRAMRHVQLEARREWQEIETFAMREMLGSLPDTVDELIKQLEDSQEEIDVTEWAKALGATSECGVCGTTILRPFAFAESIVRHYQPSNSEADAAHQRIEAAIQRSNMETGGWRNSFLCSYHEEQANKD